LIDKMVSVTHQRSRRRHLLPHCAANGLPWRPSIATTL